MRPPSATDFGSDGHGRTSVPHVGSSSSSPLATNLLWPKGTQLLCSAEPRAPAHIPMAEPVREMSTSLTTPNDHSTTVQQSHNLTIPQRRQYDRATATSREKRRRPAQRISLIAIAYLYYNNSPRPQLRHSPCLIPLYQIAAGPGRAYRPIDQRYALTKAHDRVATVASSLLHSPSRPPHSHTPPTIMHITGLRASRAAGGVLSSAMSSSRIQAGPLRLARGISSCARSRPSQSRTLAALTPPVAKSLRPPRAAFLSTTAFRSEPTKAPTSSSSSPSSSPPPTAVNPDVASQKVSEKKQAQTDYTILRQLATNVWPKGNTGVKIRVVTALTLLVAGKVLNVQVPFFFKEIVDGLNVPITSDTAVWTIAGAAIAGCEHRFSSLLTGRWSCPCLRYWVW